MEPSYWPIPSLFSVRVDSASLPRPNPDVPLRAAEELLPPVFCRLPPVAWRVLAPPLAETLVVPPELLLPVVDVLLLALLPPFVDAEDPLLRPPPLEAWPPFLATACFVRSDADARPRLDVLLLPEADLLPPRELLLPVEDELRLEELPFFAPPLDAPPLLFDDVLREDAEEPLEPPLFVEDPLLLADDPLLLLPPLPEDLVAPPREEELVFEAVLREEELLLPAPPRAPEDLEAPLLFDLEAPLLAPRLEDLEAPLDADFEAPLDEDFDAPLLDPFEAPPRPPDEEPDFEDEPRLDELLEAALDDDFEDPLLEDLEAPLELPPELLLPPFFAAAFFVAFAI